MKKTLCFDFGNTRLKGGLFENDTFKKEILLEDDSLATIENVLNLYQPQQTILASVIEHDTAIEVLLAEKTSFHKLSHLSKVNFTAAVGKPQTIGADRLALIAAAVHFYPNKNNLVIGLGSCITYNFISQRNEFLGGGISPGMEMRFKAMNEHTAFLPLVKKDWNYPVIAYDTKTNLQSGVIAGMAFEIDGFIDYYGVRYNNFNVVITGGDSVYFASQLKNSVVADLDFLFKGLYAISEVNNR